MLNPKQNSLEFLKINFTNQEIKSRKIVFPLKFSKIVLDEWDMVNLEISRSIY